MEFWASSESHKPAGEALEAARNKVEPFLNAAFAASSLASLQLRLRYVPIVMPERMLSRYQQRSKSHLKERIYDCAPAQSADHLAAFGASPEQINAFMEIVGAAAERVT